MGQELSITILNNIDGNISDLFFNTTHEDRNVLYAKHYKLGVPPTFSDERDSLRQDAIDVLASLDGLGVPTPTAGELIEDFLRRV